MLYQGYKITCDCSDGWSQIDVIGEFWDFVAQQVARDRLVGLGWNWDDDWNATKFDYALGVIGDEETLARLKAIDFSQWKIPVEYVEIELPPEAEFRKFTGKIGEIRKIYEEQVDPLGPKEYELEYINDEGDYVVKVCLR